MFWNRESRDKVRVILCTKVNLNTVSSHETQEEEGKVLSTWALLQAVRTAEATFMLQKLASDSLQIRLFLLCSFTKPFVTAPK